MRLEPKVKNRTRVQTTIRYAVVGIALAAIITVGLLIYFSLGQQQESFAQPGSGTYDTQAEAYWLTNLFNYSSDDAAFSNESATADSEQGSCFSGSTQQGVWLKFKALHTSATISVKTGESEGTITELEVVLLDNSLSEVTCASASGSNDVSMAPGALTPGNWYYLLINNASSGSTGTFTVEINNVSTTAYYVRSSGDWDDGNTWSTTGFNGSPAGSVPGVGNVVYLQNIQNELVVDNNQSCAGLIFTGGNQRSILKIKDGATLSVYGLIDWTGGDKEMEFYLDDGNLYVQDNMIYERTNGMMDHNLTVEDGSITIERSLDINRMDGAKVTMDFNNATLTVGEHITAATNGGTNKVQWILDNNCVVNIGGDLAFEYAGGSGDLAAEVKGNTDINVGGDLRITKSGGNTLLDFVLDGNSTMTVSGDVLIAYSAGGGNLNMDVKSQSTLTANGDFSVNTTGGNGQLTINIGTNAINFPGTVSVAGDFNFGSTVSNNLTVGVGKNSELEVKGDISASSSNGTLNFYDNSAILRLSGSGQQQIEGEANTGVLMIDYRKIFVENSYGNDTTDGAIILNGPVTLESSLHLIDGIIWTTSTNILTLENGVPALAPSANSYVHGPMVKRGSDDFTFPIGKHGVYAPLTISNFSIGAITNAFRAEYFNQAFSNTESVTGLLDHVSTIEHWNLERISQNAEVEVAIHWKDGDRSGISDLGDLALSRWDGNEWLLVPASTNGTVNTGEIESDNRQNTFGQFTFGSYGGANVLPVELVSFEAYATREGTSELTWETATESSNDYFEVQRSVDGTNFTNIGRVQGAGTSSERNTYEFVDSRPNSGVNYYRLKQVDFNGLSDLLPIRQVKFDEAAGGTLTLQKVAPNPFKGSAMLTYQGIGEEPVVLEVYNLSGQMVQQATLPGGSERQTYQFREEDSWQPGAYIFTLRQGPDQSESVKVIRSE